MVEMHSHTQCTKRENKSWLALQDQHQVGWVHQRATLWRRSSMEVWGRVQIPSYGAGWVQGGWRGPVLAAKGAGASWTARWVFQAIPRAATAKSAQRFVKRRATIAQESFAAEKQSSSGRSPGPKVYASKTRAQQDNKRWTAKGPRT